MGDSHLARLHREQQKHAEEACADLGAAAREAGCPLPDLAVVPVDPATGVAGVDLGVIEPKMADRLAEIIRAGVDTLAAEDRPAGSVSLIRVPHGEELVLDRERDQVGVFKRAEGDRWVLAPVVIGSGPEWLADPLKVRPAEPSDRVRAEAARANAQSVQRVS
ncbi:hypothetical protein [Streptomyces sp. NPDC085665]|uniref:hypothetical protein n=1 Tax=Streptomyces sp. NPDC085665 TaxID=3365735 RepID=UPI0037D83AC7